MDEQVYGTMECPCCDEECQILYSETEQDGDVIIVSYYSRCPRCGTPFGTKDWYHRTDWEWIGEDEAKKVLTNSTNCGIISTESEVINMDKKMYTVEELSAGDVFILTRSHTGEKRLYMKINPIDSENGYTFNAVYLPDGNLYDVRDDCEVQLVQVKITLDKVLKL